jgi:hypothetical protein
MSVKGSFKDFTFVELLQLIGLTKKTGRIEVTLDNKWAMVIFREGQVWHVEPRGFHGIKPEEVIYAIMGMPNASFVYQRVQILPALERTINISVENLIMEGTKRIDEGATAVTVDTDGVQRKVRQVLKVKAGAEARLRYAAPGTRQLTQHVDGKRTIAEVVQESGMETEPANKLIKELIQQGTLEIVEIVEDSGKKDIPLEFHGAAD